MKRQRIPGLAIVEVPPRVEASLWRRLRFEAETGCRETLFMRYRGLARSIARRRTKPYANDAGDVEHFAYEGLLQAIDRYDPLRGIPFGAFARRRIIGSIADSSAHHSEISAQSTGRNRAQRERLLALAKKTESGQDALAALSSLVSDLAIGLLLEDAGLAISPDGVDTRPNVYDTLAMRELVAILHKEVARLEEREAAIIRLHYQDGVSFTHISELLQLSKGRVSQLHGAALAKLKRRMRNAT